MLKTVSDNTVMSINAVREQYPKSKILFIITDMTDMSDIQGTVFMISDDDGSFDELCSEDEKLRNEGKQTIILGSYENGGSISVQYEIHE